MKLKQNDMVNPDHYKDASFEAIEVIEVATKQAPDGFIGMLHGNALKYLYRLWRKENSLQDARKARWYLDELIIQLEALEEFEQEHNPTPCVGGCDPAECRHYEAGTCEYSQEDPTALAILELDFKRGKISRHIYEIERARLRNA